METQTARVPQYRRPSQATLSRVSSTSTIVGKEISSETCSIRSLPSEDDFQSLQLERNLNRRTSPTESIIHWVLKVLGVLSAILFGVWAPISYRLQVTGNKSNDDAQDKLLVKVGELVDRLEQLEERLADLGSLRVLEFCDVESRRTLPACQSLTSSSNLATLLQDLGSSRPKHAPSSRRTVPSSSPTASSDPTLISEPRSISSATAPAALLSSQVPLDDHRAESLDTSLLSSIAFPKPSQPTHASSSRPKPTWETLGVPEAAETNAQHKTKESFGSHDELPEDFSLPLPMPAGLEVGRPYQMALMMGFVFGVVVCAGVLGGLRVVKRRFMKMNRAALLGKEKFPNS